MPICNGIYYMNAYTEDNLVQKTTAEYLIESLDWNESVYAMHEVFGAAGTLGRTDEGEVLLVRYLRPALERLNPGSPSAYSENEIGEKTEAVFRHVFEVYPVVPSPYYECKSA